MKQTLLCIDDEEEILDVLQEIFEDEGYQVLTLPTGKSALKLLKSKPVDLVLLDIWMKDCDGIDTLQQIKHDYPDLPVIMISGHGNIETAVKTTKMGAYSFIQKPPDYHKMVNTVKDALRESKLNRTPKNGKDKTKEFKEYCPEIIGEHSRITDLIKQIKMVAPTDGRILIYGENGTGKEVIARKIHALSNRAKYPFVEVNCAAIPETLIESELFGHEKGAFTGAEQRKIGKFDQSNKGTLFLDEIADMSSSTQAKILRVLQEQRFERVGGNEIIQVDVRIIVASNKRLEDEIAAGRFRQDLYYRLNIVPLTVPPLRDRLTDIPLLIDHFMNYFVEISNYPPKIIDAQVLEILNSYSWPGNVRELKNLVERLMILSPNETVTIHDIPAGIRNEINDLEHDKVADTVYPETLKEARDEFERNFIIQMLRKNNGNVSKTAEVINMERSYLHKKIKLYGINAD